MRKIDAIFVVPRLIEGAQAACTKCIGFFVANFSDFQITAIAGFLDFSVTGNQSRWPSSVLGRITKDSAFSILAIHEGSISHKRIKPQDKMRNTNNSLDFLRELVSNPSDLIRTKRLLHEVHTTYYLSENFSENPDDRKNDIVFLMVLLSDLLDDLYLQSSQNPIQQQCNN